MVQRATDGTGIAIGQVFCQESRPGSAQQFAQAMQFLCCFCTSLLHIFSCRPLFLKNDGRSGQLLIRCHAQGLSLLFLLQILDKERGCFPIGSGCSSLLHFACKPASRSWRACPCCCSSLRSASALTKASCAAFNRCLSAWSSSATFSSRRFMIRASRRAARCGCSLSACSFSCSAVFSACLDWRPRRVSSARCSCRRPAFSSACFA